MRTGQGSPNHGAAWLLAKSWLLVVACWRDVSPLMLLSLSTLCCYQSTLMAQKFPASSELESAEPGRPSASFRLEWNLEDTGEQMIRLSVESGTLSIADSSESIAAAPDAWQASGRVLTVDTKTLPSGWMNLSIKADLAALVTVRVNKLAVPNSLQGYGSMAAAEQSSASRASNSLLDGQQALSASISFGELLFRSWLPDAEALPEVSISRILVDQFQFDSPTASRILETGASWDCSFTGHYTGIAPGVYTLNVDQLDAEQNRIRLQETPIRVDAMGNFSPIEMSIKAPEVQGTYSLEFTLERPRSLKSFLASGNRTLRSIEFVALDPTPADAQRLTWQPMTRIDLAAATKSGVRSLIYPVSQMPQLPVPESWQQLGSLKVPNGKPISGGTLAVKSVELSARQLTYQRYLELSPKAWLRIPLPPLDPSQPHRLRLTLPTDRPNNLIVRLASDDEQQLTFERKIPGQDQQIIIHSRDCETPGTIRDYEFVIWPSSENNNALFLANADSLVPASILDAQLDQARLDIEDKASISSDGKLAGRESKHRRTGMYVQDLFPFRTERASSSTTNQTDALLPSLSEWYAACRKLIPLLEYTRSNLLIVKMDPQWVTALERHSPDTMEQHSGDQLTQDGGLADTKRALIKNGLELLFEYCQRSNIRIVLAMELNENIVGKPSDSSAYQLNSSGSSKSNQLDPLHPSAQQFIKEKIKRIVRHFGQHPSFEGLLLEVDRDSDLVFRGDLWGSSPATLAALKQSASAKTNERREAFEATIPASTTQLRLRADKLTEFYGDLADAVSAAGPKAKLYVSALGLWKSQPTEADFARPSAMVRKPINYMLASGIDPTMLQQMPNLLFLRGSSIQNLSDTDAESWILQVAQQHGLSTATRNQDPRGEGKTAALVMHQLSSCPIELDNGSDTEPQLAESNLQRFQVIVGGSTCSLRKHIVEQLFHSDLQWLGCTASMVMNGELNELQRLYSALRDLPAIHLRDVEDKSNSLEWSNKLARAGLRLRLGRTSESTFLQAINNGPWPQTIEFNLRTTSQPNIRLLGGRDSGLAMDNSPATTDGSGEIRCRLDLEPYDVLALEISDPRSSIKSVSHSCPEAVLARVKADLDTLENVLSKAVSKQADWANIFGSFERWSEGRQPFAWTVRKAEGDIVLRSTELPHSGGCSVMLDKTSPTDDSIELRSRAFEVPATGRLAVRAWLRVPAKNPTAQVRVSLCGKRGEVEVYEQSAVFGSPDKRERQLADDWGTQPATLFVSNIPVESVDHLYVKLELLDPGMCWIDDVQVTNNWLRPDEQIYLQGLMLVARDELSRDNPFPSQQLLDSHWARFLTRFHPDYQQLSTEKATTREATSKPSPRSIPRTSWNQSPSLLEQMKSAVRDSWWR